MVIRVRRPTSPYLPVGPTRTPSTGTSRPAADPWPSLPTPGPVECDPSAIIGGCFWEASLLCPVEVQRGSYGACQLSLFPSQSLDSVLGWTFVGENSSATYAQSTTQWGGTLVDPGEVLGEFIAGGRLASARSVINVVRRTSGIWGSGYWATQLTRLLAGNVASELRAEPEARRRSRLGGGRIASRSRSAYLSRAAYTPDERQYASKRNWSKCECLVRHQCIVSLS